MNDTQSLAAMPWQWLLAAAESVLGQLAHASIAALVLGAVVWIAIRLTPGLSARLRCLLWWTVSLKLLVTLVGVAVIEVALLPPSNSTTSAAPEAQVLNSRPRMGAVPGPEAAESTLPGSTIATRAETPTARGGAMDANSAPLRPGWTSLVALLWLLGVAVGVVSISRELTAARRLRRDSRPVENARIRDRFDTLKARFGIRREVALHVSERVSVPLTLGLLRPLVIVPPATLSQLDERELSMALGHELMHVRRFDLWSAWIPRLARCLFFFHPVAVIAAREYALAREAACDAAVVRELEVAPRDYGRLLIRWRPSHQQGHALEGVGYAAASTSFLQLKRRLEMLELPITAPRRLRPAHCLMALVLLAVALPVRIIAQPPEPTEPPELPEPPAAPQTFFSGGETGTFQRAIEVDESVELDVQTGSGSVTVRSGPGGQVGIAGRIVVRTNWLRSSDEAAELVRQLEENPPIEVSGGVVRVGHDLDRDFQRNVSISYNIVVPQTTVVRSRTGSGSQEVNGVAGPVQVETGSGSVRLNDIGGSANVETGSGSIRADGIAGGFTARTGSGSIALTQTAAGDVDVTTGSGSSTLRGVEGVVRARAGSGGITVEGNPTGPWEVQTGSGSITLRLPEDVGFELEAETGSGRIASDHPVVVQGTVARNRLSGEVRGGGPLIRAQTGSGGVRIE